MSCSCTAPGGVVPLDDFLPYVTPMVVGAPDEIAAHNVRLAAIELTQHAPILRREVEIDALANVNDYPLDLDDGYAALEVLRASDADRPLPSLKHLPATAASVTGFVFRPPGELFFFPAPGHDACRLYWVEVSVQPGQDTCFLDRVLYDRYAEALGAGAIYRLKNMKGADWYDPKGSLPFLQTFRAGMAHAKMTVNRGNAAGPLIMKTRRWV